MLNIFGILLFIYLFFFIIIIIVTHSSTFLPIFFVLQGMGNIVQSLS